MKMRPLTFVILSLLWCYLVLSAWGMLGVSFNHCELYNRSSYDLVLTWLSNVKEGLNSKLIFTIKNLNRSRFFFLNVKFQKDFYFQFYLRTFILWICLHYRQIVLEDSRGIWKAMKNPVDKRVKLPHDGYLKIFQLESPCLQVISLALKSIDFIIKLKVLYWCKDY